MAPPSFAPPNPLTLIHRRVDHEHAKTQAAGKQDTPDKPAECSDAGHATARTATTQRGLATIPALSVLRPSPTSPPSPPPGVVTLGRGADLRQAAREEARPLIPPPSHPDEVLVLAHGLQGMVGDFTYLLDALRSSPAGSEGRLLVHASAVNTHRTHDGIEAGGSRLAQDVRDVVGRYPTLKTISMVGFSLGGLYVRYAVGVLFDANSGCIAALKPGKVVLVASPNLGVRRFGVYRFIPEGMAKMVLKESTREVFLADEGRLLERMSRDDELPYMQALGSFRVRVLYANVRNDLMVNYGTAALDTRVRHVGGDEVDKVVQERAAMDGVDRGHDERGCKIAFEFTLREDEGTCAEDGTTARDHELEMEQEEEEVVMSRRLRRIGWRVVGVDFPSTVPIAHNRIVAMSRNAMHTWMNAGGRRVVHHLVDVLSHDFDGHIGQFHVVE